MPDDLTPEDPRPGEHDPRAPVPLARAELDAWYTTQLLSLEQIAALATERLGVPVSKTKVREWLLMLGIPRRTFSQAARVRALKRRTSSAPPASPGEGPARAEQLHLFSADPD